MLYHIDPFYQGIMSIDRFNNANARNNSKNKIVSLYHIFEAMRSAKVSSVNIRNKINPLFCLGSNTPYSTQEDISEFINFCISPSLESSRKEEVQAAFRSILNTIRERTLLRENPMGQEGQETIITKLVPQLLIDIPITREGIRIESLQDGINKEYGFPEKLLGDNLLRQTKNKNSSVVPAYVKHQYKTRDFMKTGEYVIFDFKRWIKTGQTTFRKDTYNVPIEKNITLQVNGAPQNFGIQGIVFQSGGMGGGHYVYAWCSNPSTNTWKTFNDSVVREVRGFSGGFTGFELPLGDSNFSMQNAYVLVYQMGLVHDPLVGVAPAAQSPAYTYEASGMNANTYNAMVKMSPNQYKPRVTVTPQKAPAASANPTLSNLHNFFAAPAAPAAPAGRKLTLAEIIAAKKASAQSKGAAPRSYIDPFAATAAQALAAQALAAQALAAQAPAPAAPAAQAPATEPVWEKFEGGHRRKTRKAKRKARKQTRRRR